MQVNESRNLKMDGTLKLMFGGDLYDRSTIVHSTLLPNIWLESSDNWEYCLNLMSKLIYFAA